MEGEWIAVNGVATRFDSAAFVEDELAHGLQSIKDADLLRLHGQSELYRNR